MARYEIGKDFNTKDWFVYDNETNRNVCYCDTEEEAKQFVSKKESEEKNMLTREMIIEELKARGYEVEPTNVTKNGAELKGITIGSGKLRPTIYAEQFEDEDDVDLVADRIIEIYEDSQKNAPVFDVENLMNWDYVKTRLQLCIQRKGNEDIVKRDYLDLEQYVRVFVTEDGSFKVKPEHLEKFGVDEDTLFNAAWDCTKSTLNATDMVEIMAEMMGIDVEELKADRPADMVQIVLSNESKVHGAVAMCDTEMLSSIADEYESDLAILPSSIHECIVVIVDETTNFANLNAMVREVNSTEVSPEEQLSDHAYRFNRDTREITFYVSPLFNRN